MISKSIIALLFILFTSCISNNKPSLDQIKTQYRRKLTSYNSQIDKPINERIVAAPNFVLDNLNAMDKTTIYKNYEPSEQEKQLFIDYYKLLPEHYQLGFYEHVVCIYFIENFIGGGMTDFIFDDNGTMYLVLYLNPEVLRLNLQEWISYRENAAFDDSSNIDIRVTSSDEYKGLLHTLVHEACHMYDYYQNSTPYIEDIFNKNGRPSSTSFTQDYWNDIYSPKDEYAILKGSNFSGYGLRGKIDKEIAISLYHRLKSSPFSSLYGALSWSEDFAETYTWWYLKEAYGIEYSISIYKDGQEVMNLIPTNNNVVRSRYSSFKK